MRNPRNEPLGFRHRGRARDGDGRSGAACFAAATARATHSCAWRSRPTATCCPMRSPRPPAAAPGSASAARSWPRRWRSGKLKGALARAFKGAAAGDPRRPARADRKGAAARLARPAGARNARRTSLSWARTASPSEARMGKVAALYHAADASDDGARKLDQAWRVGSDAEGTGLAGAPPATGPRGFVCGIGPRQCRPPGAGRSRIGRTGRRSRCGACRPFSAATVTALTGGEPDAAGRPRRRTDLKDETSFMSDSNNTPRERKPLGLKRSIDAGEVKQTFSHGRTNKVVVEVKRRRSDRQARRGRGCPRLARARTGSAAPPPPPPPPAPQQGRARRRDAAGARRAHAARGRGRPPAPGRGSAAAARRKSAPRRSRTRSAAPRTNRRTGRRSRKPLAVAEAAAPAGRSRAAPKRPSPAKRPRTAPRRAPAAAQVHAGRPARAQAAREEARGAAQGRTRRPRRRRRPPPVAAS